MVQLIAFLTTFLTLLAFPAPSGSKSPYKRSSIIKTYRTCMKEKNFTRARQVLIDARQQYPEAAADPQFYRYEVDALNELICAENRKIYLQTNPDTTTYFHYIYDLYVSGLKCDSVEQKMLLERLEDGKNATPKWRNGVGQAMLPYRKNLLGAGKYFYKKKDYATAFKYLDLYAKTQNADVFLNAQGVSSVATDPNQSAEVAVLSVLSAYASSNREGVMAYLSESLRDEEHRPRMLELGAKTAAELGDTTQMVQLLEQGFSHYPEVEYFFITMVKFYNDTGDYGQALQRTQRMTALMPQRRDFWYMAGAEQLLLGHYADALASFQQCVNIKADDAEAYAAIGNIHLHHAHEAYAQFNTPLSDPAYTKQKAAINALYKQACAAFEQARKFDENHPHLWLEGLRETYFKLNKGKALNALEKTVSTHP